MRTSSIIVLLAALAAGCASGVPEPIRRPPADNPGLSAVRVSVDAFVGRLARWGGTVSNIENRKSDTLIEIVERPLNSEGRPQESDRSEGRFMIRVAGFADPVVFKEGRRVTAAGIIEGETTRPIGEFPYRYPILRAQTLHLWEPLPEREYYPDPFWPYPGYPWRYRYYPYYYPFPYY